MFSVEPISFNFLENTSINITSLPSDEIDYFVLTVNKPDRTYTGLLCSISVKDENIIRGHESISIEKKNCVKNCLMSNGLQKSPVLMTYKDSALINALQRRITAKKPCYEISFNNESFSLWKVSHDVSRLQLQKELLSCGGLYIADGHHRWAAINEGIINDSENSKKMFCHLLPSSQLSIYAYHRILKGELPLSTVFQVLKDKFNVVTCEACIKPIAHDQFGMFIEGSWYKVSAKFNEEFKDNLNAEILNNEIIQKLSSYDPSISLSYFCDTCSMQEFEQNILSSSNTIGFTTMPISTKNLIHRSDHLKILPQKSTWIEPKLPEGLFNYYF